MNGKTFEQLCHGGLGVRRGRLESRVQGAEVHTWILLDLGSEVAIGWRGLKELNVLSLA